MSASTPVSVEDRIAAKAIAYLKNMDWLKEHPEFNVYQAECGVPHIDESCIFVGVSPLENIRGPLWNASLTLSANAGNAVDGDKADLKALDALCGQTLRHFSATPSDLTDSSTVDPYNVDGCNLAVSQPNPAIDTRFTMRPRVTKLFISYTPN